MPEVDDQHCPLHIARVPCFVFERVIENQTSSLLPLARFRAHAQGAGFGYDQPQVTTQACVDGAAVRPDMGFRAPAPKSKQGRCW